MSDPNDSRSGDIYDSSMGSDVRHASVEIDKKGDGKDHHNEMDPVHTFLGIPIKTGTSLTFMEHFITPIALGRFTPLQGCLI